MPSGYPAFIYGRIWSSENAQQSQPPSPRTYFDFSFTTTLPFVPIAGQYFSIDLPNSSWLVRFPCEYADWSLTGHQFECRLSDTIFSTLSVGRSLQHFADQLEQIGCNIQRPWEETRKPCQMCQEEPAIKGERFCAECKKKFIRQMKEDGYLQKLWVPRIFNDERGRKGMRNPHVLGGEPY